METRHESEWATSMEGPTAQVLRQHPPVSVELTNELD
jgi:hypothetical protein